MTRRCACSMRNMRPMTAASIDDLRPKVSACFALPRSDRNARTCYTLKRAYTFWPVFHVPVNGRLAIKPNCTTTGNCGCLPSSLVDTSHSRLRQYNLSVTIHGPSGDYGRIELRSLRRFLSLDGFEDQSDLFFAAAARLNVTRYTCKRYLACLRILAKHQRCVVVWTFHRHW
jgi:hypothetical protein